MHAFALESLQAEQAELLQRHNDVAQGEGRNELLRELWIVNGALDEGLDTELLRAVANWHQEHGTVPEGYDPSTLRLDP